tara:strand:+ start:711 stop:1319 length:609 start_codon:yes stop_codon:yes gene_type:complete
MLSPPPPPRPSIGLALQRRALLPLIAAGLGSWPSFAAEPERAPSAVLDLQGYLPPSDLDRLDRILTKLEADTGFKVRVLTQSRETAPEMGPVLQRWRVGDGGRLRDPNAVLMVADRGLRGKLEQAGGSFIRYEVGDNVRVRVPDSYWGRLQREYAKIDFIQKRGEAAAIITSCELIISCLRNDDFSDPSICTDVPKAGESFF